MGCCKLHKAAQSISTQPRSSPWMNFSLTQMFLIFFLALLIAKYDQPSSGNQKKKENMGRNYFHMEIQLPQSHSDQTSTVPSPRVSSTCSREEKEPVTVIRSNTTTLGAAESKAGTIPSPCNCPPGFTAALLPKNTGMSWETCSLGCPGGLSRLRQNTAGFRASLLHPSIGISSFP